MHCNILEYPNVDNESCTAFTEGPFYLCLSFIPISFLLHFHRNHTLTNTSTKYWNVDPSVYDLRIMPSLHSALDPGYISSHLTPLDPLEESSIKWELYVCLTVSYENWLKKHIWIYPSYCCETQFSSVQSLSPYMTTGKTITLTRQTFVGKVMHLLFNLLSRLLISFLPQSKCF